MTAISYTASRGLAKTGFVASAIDISVAAVDDSFNSVGGDFLGLLAGQWITVDGSAVDDGWHQVDIDSTANKILTLSALTDEVAGSLITITGYYDTIGDTATLETSSHQLSPSRMATTKKAESLSGVVETLLYKEIEYWEILTDHITEAELPLWYQFISSVRAGEAFDFDAYGTISIPDNVQSCILDGDPKVTRVDATRTYQISMKLRVV